MKKKTKNLLVMLGVLLVVGAAAAVLILTPPKTEEAEPSSEAPTTETIALIEKAVADLKSIEVENTSGKFMILADQSGETTAYRIEELGDAPQAAGLLSGLVGAVLPLNAVKEIEAPDNLADFGLSGQGEATLTLHYQDGGSDELIVGLPSSGTSGRYVLLDGKVYIVSSVGQAFFKEMLDFVDTSVLTIPDLMTTDEQGNEAVGADEIGQLTLSGKNFPQTIEITTNTSDSSGMSPNRMIAPLSSDANSTLLGEIAAALKNITAVKAVKVGATEADLAQFGLDEPYAQADFTINGHSHSVRISDVNEDGLHYLRLDDSPVLYTIDKASVVAWSGATVNSLRSSYIFLANIQDVNRLTLTDGNGIVTFDVTREINEEKSTEDRPNYNLFPSIGGKEINYELTYQPLYGEMLALPILSSEVVEYDRSKAVLTIEYGYFDSANKDVVSFYAIEGQDRYAAEHNGEFTGILRRTSIDGFMANIQKAANNEELKKS